MVTKAQKERRIIEVRSAEIYIDYLTLERITQMFQNFEYEQMIKKGFEIAKPTVLDTYYYYGDSEYNLIGYRFETNDELELRISDLEAVEKRLRDNKKNAKKKKEKEDYETYLRLKEQFEAKEKAGN